MAGQQICLKWNSFQTNIVTSFENLWEEEGLVDVTLASDGQCIRAHKVILSACSPFFRRVFQSNPCQHPVIILQDVHFTELESLLCFVYKGEVNIGQESLPALLKAAETLQIRGLSGASEQVKEKMAVPRKTQPSESPSEPSLHPPTKRHRGCSSPPLPSTPTYVEHPPTSSSPPCTPPLALTAKTEGREEEVQVPPCGDIEAGVAEEILRETEGETSCTPHGVGTDSMCGGDDEDEDYGDEDQPLAHLSLKMEPPEFDCGGDSNSLPLALTLTLPTSSEELNIPTLLSKSRRSSDCRLDATQIKGEGGNNSLQHRRSRNRGLGGCGMGARRKRRHYNNFIWRGPAAATSLLGVTEGRVAIQGSGGQEEQQAGKEAESAVREGEEAEGESAQGPAVAAPPSLLIEKSEGVLNEGDINEESGPLPPYSLLPHACLLPSPSILSAWAKARTPEQLSCDLMRLLFSTEERLVCNVNGKMGKRRFDAHKVLLIREVVRHHYNECSGAGIMSGREGTREHCEVIEKIPAQVEVTPVTQCLSYPATPFPCPFCERTYTSWGFRRRHIKAVHAFAHPLQLSCKWCPKPPGGSMMVNNGPAQMSVSKWERHVVDKHGITMAEVHSSLEILEEAHMVLQIAEPLRLASISAGVRVNNCEKGSKISSECDVGQSCGRRTPMSDTSRRRTNQGFEDEETSNNKRYRVANNGVNQDWPGNSGFGRYQ